MESTARDSIVIADGYGHRLVVWSTPVGFGFFIYDRDNGHQAKFMSFDECRDLIDFLLAGKSAHISRPRPGRTIIDHLRAEDV